MRLTFFRPRSASRRGPPARHEIGGKPFNVQLVAAEALEAQRGAATDLMDQAFAALMLAYARGNSIPMEETLRKYPVQMTSVREYAIHALSD